MATSERERTELRKAYREESERIAKIKSGELDLERKLNRLQQDNLDNAKDLLGVDKNLANQANVQLEKYQAAVDSGKLSVEQANDLAKTNQKILESSMNQAEFDEIINDIEKDLKSKQRMFRLIQGDVGTGKTIVSLISALNTIKSPRCLSVYSHLEPPIILAS